MDNYTIKIAKGLANNADARLIRQQVFVEEQGFVNEFDDIDHEAYHAVIYTGGYPIATGRLFDENGEAHIGRICVRKAYRGRDLGRMIVEALEKQAEKVGYKEVGLSALLFVCMAGIAAVVVIFGAVKLKKGRKQKKQTERHATKYHRHFFCQDI